MVSDGGCCRVVRYAGLGLIWGLAPCEFLTVAVWRWEEGSRQRGEEVQTAPGAGSSQWIHYTGESKVAW